MNEHAGPACALSVLIVGLFAVLLHDRDHTPSVKAPIAKNSSDLVPERIDPPPNASVARTKREIQLASPSPDSTPKNVQEAQKVASTKPPLPVKSELVVSSVPPSPPPPVATKTISVSPETIRPLTAAPVRSTFTVVRSGEKLADVATRVYGSSESTEQLWRANRDQVAQIDSVLPRGALLRTP